jgi:hypothetical protein
VRAGTGTWGGNSVSCQDVPGLQRLRAVASFIISGGGRRTPCLRRQVPQSGREDHRRNRHLLAFYDYPAEHWIHLRTTNPIESTFATVRLRQRVTKGPGSRAAGVAMAFKLIESAQARWRAVNAPHLVALVRAGARFENSKLVERPDESRGDQLVALTIPPASLLRRGSGYEQAKAKLCCIESDEVAVAFGPPA